MKCFLSFWLGLALAGTAVAAGNPDAARAAKTELEAQTHLNNSAVNLELAAASQYTTAYDTMQQADCLNSMDMPEEAIELYLEALSQFQKLLLDYPNWETDTIAFRVKYCQEELAQLRREPTLSESLTRIYGQPAKPVRLTARATPLNGASLAKQLRLGLQQERAEQIHKALAAYLTILQEQPLQPEALKGASRCYLRMDLPDEARALLQRSLEQSQPDAEENLLMALIHCREREFYKAYQLLLIVLHQQPTNALAHLTMGVALAGNNKLSEAQQATQKALQLDPQLADAYYNMARLSLRLNPASRANARNYYFNALRRGGKPDPTLEKQLR